MKIKKNEGTEQPVQVVSEVSARLDRVDERMDVNWIKCSERMPETSLSVLVCSRASHIYVAEYFPDIEHWCDIEGGYFTPDAITHWMPLPEPPATER